MESRLPTDVPGDQSLARTVRPAGAIISAYDGQVVITGTGFLPNRPVTVRIAHSVDAVVDYLACTSDADGAVSAPLPEPAVSETGRSAFTDDRPNPGW